MKSAYPNFSAGDNFKPTYNLNKWLTAMREIYTNLHFGTPFKEAFANITDNWDTVEKNDFSVWLQYYQSGNQHKYTKTAQFYVGDNIPGYLLPNPKSVPSPIVPADISEPITLVQNDVQDKIDQKERRSKIENQRKKIIGRLHSAIKHLTSEEGHMLAGEEFDKLLSSMYELLKDFQKVNKISVSGQLYYDLIIRQANRLGRDGFTKSSKFLRKFAQQTPGKLDFPQGVMPIASKQSDGVAGSLESNAPPIASIATPPPAALTEDKEESDPLDELLENLETAGLTDSNDTEDSEEELVIDLDDALSVEAQLAPEPTLPPMETDEVSLPTEQPNFVQETSDQTPQAKEPNDIDAILDSALANVSVQDAITRLEDVIVIFKNRQLARELSMADLILNRLGMSALFPEISESLQKLYESTSYILTRLEKVNSQLRGTIDTSNIELVPNKVLDLAPGVQQAKDQIETKQDEDKKRREMRKQLETENIMNPKEPVAPEAIPAAPLEAPAPSPGEEIQNQPAQIV